MRLTTNTLTFIDEYERNHCVQRDYVGAIIEERSGESIILKCVDGTWNRIKIKDGDLEKIAKWFCQ